jgi:hypothetical protein
MSKVIKFPKPKRLIHKFKAEPKPKPKRINREMVESLNKEITRRQGIKHYMGRI